jgi:hypothetical protein
MNALKVIGSMVFLGLGAFVVLGFIGLALEFEARYHDEHDRCMRHATNGYEIERCR